MAAKKKRDEAQLPEVSPEDFVTAWQAGATPDAVAEALGYTDEGGRERVMRRAAYYRKAGVNLKKMQRGVAATLDIAALNALVKES